MRRSRSDLTPGGVSSESRRSIPRWSTLEIKQNPVIAQLPVRKTRQWRISLLILKCALLCYILPESEPGDVWYKCPRRLRWPYRPFLHSPFPKLGNLLRLMLVVRREAHEVRALRWVPIVHLICLFIFSLQVRGLALTSTSDLIWAVMNFISRRCFFH